jgi:hypothetical protein
MSSSRQQSQSPVRRLHCIDLTLRPSRARSCLVPASSKPVVAENISADAFIMVVRTFKPFSVKTNRFARRSFDQFSNAA